MILLIDNYDSFVHNLARYVRRLGLPTEVVRNDAIDVAGVRRLRPCAIILSPGPGTPEQAGASIDIVRDLHTSIPMLGVCLGHQALGAALGARIVRAVEPVHGRASHIVHDRSRLFEGLPSPLNVGRYHSLVIDEATLPKTLQVTARTDDGVVMALAHATAPLYGVQFHPESILTEGGHRLLANFLKLAGQTVGDPLPTLDDERLPPIEEKPLPTTPVTF